MAEHDPGADGASDDLFRALEQDRRSLEKDPKLSRYEIRGRLGEGATALVYRAWDVELRRHVALKVMREIPDLSGLARDRFRREAQACARIAHPNVVAVFDTGEHAGNLYLVMELVEGKSLQDLLAGALPDPRAAVELMEKVSRGVAAAHARGVVHRDLKPGNILIAPSGEPKVGDFGLAHLPDATQALTRTGAVLGTPLYMAPEQVEGRDVSARTDVYALGAILYQLLAGRPPHPGERVPEIYRKIVRDDAVPPRTLAPGLAPDLDTIVLKALERDPGRRYVDAAALADDLRRHLDGRPIEARPVSRAYRLWKGVRRHRAAALLGVASAALLAVVGVGWKITRAHEKELRRERQEALESLRQNARLSVEAALHLRRAGDAAGMKRFLPPLEEAYARAVRLDPRTPEADFLLGRMHRALMNDERALEHQARSLDRDAEYAPALYERLVLRARRHDTLFRTALEAMRAQELQRVMTEESRPSLTPTQREVERWRPEVREARESVIADGERLRKAMRNPRRAEAGRWIADAHAVAADGILDYCEQRYEGARARLEEALAGEPHLEEAWEALARVFEGREREAASSREKEALRREAERVYTDAIFLDQAYLPFHLGRGNTFMRDAVAKLRSGGDPLADHAAAEKDLAECVRIHPEHAEAHQRLGAVRLDRGRFLSTRGRDPLPDWTAAEKDFDRSLDLRKDSVMSWSKRGFLHLLRGTHEAALGGDPLPRWRRAESDLTEGLRVQPGITDPWLRLGMLRTSLGQREKERGGDPLPAWGVADLNLTEALRISPGFSEVLARRGVLRFQRGLYRSERREDPSRDWKEAEADFAEALASEDLYVEIRTLRGVLRTHAGRHCLREGGDPLRDWDPAEDDFRRAAGQGPDYLPARQAWGDLLWSRADYFETKGDAAKAKTAWAECAREYREVLRINPRAERAVDGRRREALRRSGAPTKDM